MPATIGDNIGRDIAQALAEKAPREVTAIWRAIGNALQPYLGGTWERVAINPATTGLARDTFTIVFQTSSGLPIGVWIKTGTGDTAWESLWPAADVVARSAASAAQSTANTAVTNAATAQGTATSALGVANAAIPASEKGAANGVATLGSSSLVPTAQLPKMGTTTAGIAPLVTDVSKYLKGDGSWDIPNGSLFATVYDVQFASLASQDIKADATVTIDGKSWQCFNSANATTMAVQNGSGLYIKCNTNNSNIYNSTRSAPIAGIKLSEISGIGARDNEEIRVWWLLDNVHVPNANYEYNGAEIIEGRSGTWGVSDIQRTAQVRGYNTSVFSAQVLFNAFGGTDQYYPASQASFGYNVIMFRIFGSCIETYYGSTTTAELPNYSDMIFNGRASRFPSAGLAGKSGYAQGLLATVFAFTGNSAGLSDVLVKRLRIDRIYPPPVTAAPVVNPWTTAYEQDFSSLANQTIAEGANTIGGKTLNALNVSAAQTFAIQNGSGLYIRGSTTSNDFATGPQFWWNLDQLFADAPLNGWSEFRVWFCVSTVQTWASVNEGHYLGAMLGPATGQALGNTYRIGGVSQYWQASTPKMRFGQPAVSNTGTFTTSLGAATADTWPTSAVYMVNVAKFGFSGACYVSVHSSTTPEWPAVSSMSGGVPAILYSTQGFSANNVKLAIFGMVRTLSNGGRADLLLRRIKLEYR